MGSIFSCNRDRIVVRQILDPYVNAQYVASHEVTLGRNGNLSMKKIQSLRMFGDEFLVTHTYNFISTFTNRGTDCVP